MSYDHDDIHLLTSFTFYIIDITAWPHYKNISLFLIHFDCQLSFLYFGIKNNNNVSFCWNYIVSTGSKVSSNSLPGTQVLLINTIGVKRAQLNER